MNSGVIARGIIVPRPIGPEQLSCHNGLNMKNRAYTHTDTYKNTHVYVCNPFGIWILVKTVQSSLIGGTMQSIRVHTIYIHTYIHAYIHTYIHTHIHTYIHPILFHPLAILFHPLAILFHPLAILFHPLAILFHPLAILFHPLAILFHPLAILFHPLAILFHPWNVDDVTRTMSKGGVCL